MPDPISNDPKKRSTSIADSEPVIEEVQEELTEQEEEKED